MQEINLPTITINFMHKEHCESSHQCAPLNQLSVASSLAAVYLHMKTNLMFLGSSFTANQTGQRDVVDDLNSATPSVLAVNEMLAGCDKNCSCFWYSLPS